MVVGVVEVGYGGRALGFSLFCIHGDLKAPDQATEEQLNSSSSREEEEAEAGKKKQKQLWR
jgi:hypothetical protein